MNNKHPSSTHTHHMYPQNTLVPIVVEKIGGNERAYDIYSRLLKERIIFVGGIIDDYLANLIIAQLLFLESTSTERTINLYINSPGGAITAGLAIYDTMQYMKSPIQTICIGQAASIGALLLASGTPKKRRSLPSSRIMIHQPWGGVEGQTSDIHIQTKELIRIKELIISYFIKHTGKSKVNITRDIERDNFMSAEQALAYGVIDEIVTTANKKET